MHRRRAADGKADLQRGDEPRNVALEHVSNKQHTEQERSETHLVRRRRGAVLAARLLGGRHGKVGRLGLVGRVKVLHLVLVEALGELEAGVLVPVVLERDNLDRRVGRLRRGLNDGDDLVEDGVAAGPDRYSIS